jgi:hypothetical protein
VASEHAVPILPTPHLHSHALEARSAHQPAGDGQGNDVGIQRKPLIEAFHSIPRPEPDHAALGRETTPVKGSWSDQISRDVRTMRSSWLPRLTACEQSTLQMRVVLQENDAGSHLQLQPQPPRALRLSPAEPVHRCGRSFQQRVETVSYTPCSSRRPSQPCGFSRTPSPNSASTM